MKTWDYIRVVLAFIGIFFGVFTMILNRQPSVFGVVIVILGLTVLALLIRKH